MVSEAEHLSRSLVELVELVELQPLAVFVVVATGDLGPGGVEARELQRRAAPGRRRGGLLLQDPGRRRVALLELV